MKHETSNLYARKTCYSNKIINRNIFSMLKGNKVLQKSKACKVLKSIKLLSECTIVHRRLPLCLAVRNRSGLPLSRRRHSKRTKVGEQKMLSTMLFTLRNALIQDGQATQKRRCTSRRTLTITFHIEVST